MHTYGPTRTTARERRSAPRSRVYPVHKNPDRARQTSTRRTGSGHESAGRGPDLREHGFVALVRRTGRLTTARTLTRLLDRAYARGPGLVREIRETFVQHPLGRWRRCEVIQNNAIAAGCSPSRLDIVHEQEINETHR